MVLPESNNVHRIDQIAEGRNLIWTLLSTVCLATSFIFLKANSGVTSSRKPPCPSALPGYMPPLPAPRMPCIPHRCIYNSWFMCQVAETGPDESCVPNNNSIKSLLNVWMDGWVSE